MTSQTEPDGSTWGFAYTLNASGAVTATTVTDPRGHVEKLTFNGSGQILTDVKAYGTEVDPDSRTIG